jgi:hypothetical protein
MIRIPSPDTLGRLRDEVERRLSDYLTDLEAIVNIESGSYTKAGVDEVETWMADRLRALGATIERHPHDELGDTVVATFDGRADGPDGDAHRAYRHRLRGGLPGASAIRGPW